MVLKLAASLGITYAEAEEMIVESAIKNVQNFVQRFVACVCPYTGTIEYMEVRDE